MKLRTKLILITAVICACTSANAEKFDNWPTYASSPLTNWPKASEYDKLVEDFAWCHNALTERCIATGTYTNNIAPAIGTTRTPKSDIQRFKDKEEILIPVYVNHTLSNSFTSRYLFPMWAKTGIVAELTIPSDFLDNTPYSRCLDGITPAGWTNTYSVSNLKDAISELKWTRYYDYRPDSSMYAQHIDCNGIGAGLEYALENARQDWTNSTSRDGAIYFFSANRNAYYYGGMYGWVAGAGREESKPLLSGIPVLNSIDFDWEGYIVPNVVDEGDDWNWGYKNEGWQEHIMTQWDTGAAAAGTTNVEAQLIGGGDECPFNESPQPSTTGTTVHVDRFHWLLKWNFTE